MERSKLEFAEITIINWEAFQKRRKDVRVSHWFKLSSRIFYNDKIQCLSNNELILYLTLLSVCSENDSNMIRVRTELIMSLKRVRTRNQYYQALAALARYGLVTYTLRQNRIEENRVEETKKNSPIPTSLINKSEVFNAQQAGTDSSESFHENRDARSELKIFINDLAGKLDMNKKTVV